MHVSKRIALFLLSVLTSSVSHGQAVAAPTSPAGSVQPSPQAAKIAFINFEQVVLATNEGQTVVANVKKATESADAHVRQMANELQDLKKKLASVSQSDRQSLIQTISAKEVETNKEAQAASTQYNTALQEALGKVAAKVAVVARTYAQVAGFNIVLDTSASTNPIFWVKDGTMDISTAVRDAYNKQSGVPAPR